MGFLFQLLFFLAGGVIPLVSSLSPDGRALLALSKPMVIPPSTTSTWNPSHHKPCKWVGILCDSDGNVVALDLPGRQISGTLGPEIGQLKQLRRLDLGSNSLSGSIPSELGNCSLLEYMDLSSNAFSGEIPRNLFHSLRRLSYLSLWANFLSGEIPASVFQIPDLDTLYLNQNNFTGSIPNNVGNMTRATVLWLGDNSLSGILPKSISNCSNLQELYLLNNQLTGTLPEDLGNLRELIYFDASGNDLSGNIPFGLGSCRNLKQLVLSYNRFEGGIPGGLGNGSALTDFAVVSTNLSGQIPASIGLLTELSTLYLSENHFSGTVPPEIGKCRYLKSLQIYENRLEGPIPRELGLLSNLQSLELFSNSLSGEVPVEVWRIPTLEVLLVYNNNLSGQLPLEVTALGNLRNVSLYNNRFSGVIPQGLGINSSLEQIDFTNNSLVGGIPPDICYGKQLRVLNLGFNLLTGSVPLGIGSCSSLRRLILSHNDLNGSLPDFAKNSNLLYVDFRENNINGHIPRSIGHCVNLTLINWSSNTLSGPLPEEIGNLLNLQVFNLSGNSLQGQLPRRISHCSKLYILDLGYNSLNGSVPLTLENLTLLSHLILRDNQFTGDIPNFFSQLGTLLELGLGGNLFGGIIPSSLGALQNLAISLNLSGNGLIGTVPLEFANLKNLQSLDLSLNNLTGSLRSLGDLDSLIVLNVSYNHFMGPIPKKLLRFLDSSPSSFRANPGLCIPCQSGEISCAKGSNFRPCSESGNRKDLRKIEIVIIVLGSFVFFVLVLLLLSFIFLRDKRSLTEHELDLIEGSFLLNKVMEATDNLNEKYILGSGAHGTVYKAFLSPEKVYAVKKLVFAGQKGSNVSMVREIRTVGRIRHRNLVKLVGFWLKNDYGLILYDYMENGSLHDVLHEIKPTPVLEWNMRYRIALGTAQALAYLHHDCDPPIVHRDIKPKNILLDGEMEPHVSDFGIAKLMDHYSVSSQSSNIMGTIGYMPPEVAFSTRKSMESDVYSYGIVLLELLTRKRALEDSIPGNTDLVSWVCSIFNGSDNIESIVDPSLMHEVMGSPDIEEVRSVLLLALKCAAKEAGQRPTMRDVVKQLTVIKSKVYSPLLKGKN